MTLMPLPQPLSVDKLQYGESTIAGAANQTYVATANGSYAVIVTTNGCADTSACKHYYSWYQ